MSAPTYTIATPADFLLVPTDRLPVCLHEFRAWLEFRREFEPTLTGIASLQPEFIWVDDGLAQMRPVCRAPDMDEVPLGIFPIPSATP